MNQWQGLLMNIFAASYNADGVFHLQLDLFYTALALMTLAQAALPISLEAFLEDQMIPRTDSDDAASQRERRRKFWWTLVSFVAAIFVQFGPLARQSFKERAIILTALMGANFFVFFSGTRFYNRVPRNLNPFKDTETVIVRAVANRKADYTLTAEVPPRVPWLRWLDKASIATETVTSPSSSEVRGVKLLLHMIPLWSCFLSLSLVVASGSTLFFEEADFLAPGDIGVILLFTNLQRLTDFMVSEISSYAVEKLRERKQYNEHKMELVRVGVGMSFSVPCCIAAWVAATSRRRSGGTMWVYWMTPQYILIGVMTGLSLDGFESFYRSQVSETLARYGLPFGELVMGVGRFVSIICILVLSTGQLQWFEIKLEDSRVDKYYILLGVFNLVSVVIYCLVAYWYGDDDSSFLVGDEEEIGVEDDQLMVDGLASLSTAGPQRRLSRLSKLHRRTASEPERTSVSGDNLGELPEYPLLPTDGHWRSKSLS